MFRALLCAGLLAAAGTASAQEGEGSIDYRQNLMRAIGANMAAIGDVLKHGLPVQDNLAGHAGNLETHAGQIATAFAQRATEGATDAKPEIWDDPEGFMQAIEGFRAAAAKLSGAAAGGDMAAFGGQVRELGLSCGGCHEGYRKPKEESYKRR